MKRHESRILGLIAGSFCLLATGCMPSGDLFIQNARIWTADPSNGSATCCAIHHGRFVYVGNDPIVAANRVAGEARRIDAHGVRIVPGLIDAHLHLLSGGRQLSQLQLRDVPDRAAFVAAVGAWAKKSPKGQWITGGRWSTESWPDPAQPTKDWIDSVTRDHPVLLSRMDGHGAIANSAALKIAGIDANGPPDPPGGQIERDPKTNEPTGIVKDAAIELIAKHIPEPSDRELDAALRAAMKEANRHGITSVHTMSPWRDMAVLDRARHVDGLTTHIRVMIQEDDWKSYVDPVKDYPSDERLRVCGIKQYADGSLGSRTAYLADPYSDNPTNNSSWRGILRECLKNDKSTVPQTGQFTPLESLAKLATVRKLVIATHAIGDEACHLVIDAYGASQVGCIYAYPDRCKPPVRYRLRIEHAQHLLPSDIPRFAQWGIIASMQPYHKADDGRYAEKAIGPERCKTSYAFRSLLDAGAHVAFGSDWPVVSLNPFLGIHAAVTGKTLDGKVFVPEQNITVEAALRCYTTGAAYAAGDEGSLGKIKVGYAADFVVLDDDPLTIAPEKIRDVRVRETYVAGRRVWPRQK